MHTPRGWPLVSEAFLDRVEELLERGIPMWRKKRMETSPERKFVAAFLAGGYLLDFGALFAFLSRGKSYDTIVWGGVLAGFVMWHAIGIYRLITCNKQNRKIETLVFLLAGAVHLAVVALCGISFLTQTDSLTFHVQLPISESSIVASFLVTLLYFAPLHFFTLMVFYEIGVAGASAPTGIEVTRVPSDTPISAIQSNLRAIRIIRIVTLLIFLLVCVPLASSFVEPRSREWEFFLPLAIATGIYYAELTFILRPLLKSWTIIGLQHL